MLWFHTPAHYPPPRSPQYLMTAPLSFGVSAGGGYYFIPCDTVLPNQVKISVNFDTCTTYKSKLVTKVSRN